jgi:HAD superfamily hydrolase (TIGR01509 family)
MSIKAVIFDMDGVIVDSEPIESLAWEKVLAEYGIKPIYEQWGLIHTVGGIPTIRDIINKHNLPEEDIEIIRVKKRGFYEEQINKGISPMPGFVPLLKILKIHKLKVGVASTRNEHQVKVVIRKLKFEKEFDGIAGFSEDVRRKPAPDIYLKTATKLGVEPKLCVAFEDSETGILAAKRAGMKVIAVPNQYTMYQDFSKADKIVDSLSEITIPILESL